MDENKKFDCPYCEHNFIAHKDEYKTIFWHGDILLEAFCPICGKIIQNKTGFSGSGGGKF